MMEKLLELGDYLKGKLLKIGAQDVIIEISNGVASQIKFVNNKIAKTGTEKLIDMDVFVVKDKKILTTTLKDFSHNGADNLTKAVSKFFKHMHPNSNYVGIAKGPFKYKKIPETYDEKVIGLNEKEVDLVEAGINAALEAGAKRTAGIFESSYENVYLLTSGGVSAQDKGTSLYFSIRALVDKMASGHMTSSSRIMKKLDVEGAGRFAGEIAKMAKNPKSGVAGKFDVIFEPLAFACILERAFDSASIFDVEAGTSCFAGKLGKKVASPIVNLIDDGRLPNGFHSSAFDAEGVPTQRNTIVDNGILKTYLHNTSTAKRYGVKTTANAGLVAPIVHNGILEKGDLSKNELFENVKRGLYITNVWYTRFQNYATGDFSTIPRDGIFLIENGKIKYPISNIRVSENIINILKNISSIANEPKQIYSWEVSTPITCPLVLVKDVNITKPKK